ncbi:hypothetical protein ACI00D_004419 [Cronobacter dublinensis]
MKEVTIDSVRERIANLELQANYSPIGGRLNEFEIACLRELLELLALREKKRRAVAYLKAVNDRSDPEFKDVLVDYAIRELDGVAHLSAPPAPVVPDEMTPEMMREVQLHSELGAYAAANLSGAYGLFDEFWKVACRAAMLSAPGKAVVPDDLEAIKRDALRYAWVRGDIESPADEGDVYMWDKRGQKYEECGDYISGTELDAYIDSLLEATALSRLAKDGE